VCGKNCNATLSLKTRRPHIKRLVFIFFAAYCCISFAAEPPEVLIERVPDWTTPTEIHDRGNPLEKESVAGAFLLLFDVEINGATHERFIRIAKKFVSPAGVEANSRLSFVFDPSYQQLVLHNITIHRGDQVLNRLEPEKIRVIQQEKELDRLIYNGAKTALLFLEDVRVGDWVEFAYTIRGRNPIEAGHFFDVMQLRYSFPIQTENYRLLWPATNQPIWAQIGGDAPKNRRVTGQFYEFAWHWENRRGEESEDFLPVSSIQYALVHFSDYKDWPDVASWAEKSFHPEQVSQELYQKIVQLRDENATSDQRVLKALQFVQDDIRYLGIENGINSHRPTDPSIVFARRYGDCKDKALLFCTILRFFDGVDAAPVLVSSHFRGGVKTFIATPLVFDHAIVRVILDGKTNFVDVTRSFQRGPLNRHFVDDFGAGLLLDENSPGLITIPPMKAGMPKTLIEESYDVSTRGAAQLLVRSTYEGRDADLARQAIASTSLDSRDRNVLNVYEKYYAGVVSAGHTETYDDESSNRIEVIRRFSIPNIWKPALQTNFLTCEFISYGILDNLYIPARKERRLPLAIPFPQNFIHTIRVKSQEPCRMVPGEKKIQTQGFIFRNRTICTNNQMETTCQLITLNHGIAAKDMPEYWSALNEIPRFMGVTITKPRAGTGFARNDSPNWTIWIAGICYCGVLSMIAIFVYRYQPKSPPEFRVPPDPNLTGLGGWLVLLGIGLVATPFARALLMIRTGEAYSTATWRLITDSTTSGYDPMLAPLLLFERFSQLTLLVFSFLLIALFFRRKRVFPIALILYLSLQFAVVTTDEVLVKTRNSKTVTTFARQNTSSAAATTLGPLIVWGLYVARSRRVKMTFLN